MCKYIAVKAKATPEPLAKGSPNDGNPKTNFASGDCSRYFCLDGNARAHFDRIKRSFEHTKSGAIFDCLLNYSSLTTNQLACIMGYNKGSHAFFYSWREVRYSGYVEDTQGRSPFELKRDRPGVQYRLSKKAVWSSPELDREVIRTNIRNSNDGDRKAIATTGDDLQRCSLDGDPAAHFDRIKRSFEHTKSGAIFDCLLNYSSLTTNQLACIMGYNKGSHAFFYSWREVRYSGYVADTQGRSSFELKRDRSGVQYRLSKKAFWSPELNREVARTNIRNGNDLELEKEKPDAYGRRNIGKKRKTSMELKETKRWRTKQKVSFRKSKRARLEPRRKEGDVIPPIYQNDDIMSHITGYLDSKTLLFGMAKTSKCVRSLISHTSVVLSAMATPRTQRLAEQLVDLVQTQSIYTPSPMRMLRILVGKRCERCNRTKVNSINNLGLLTCRSCTKPLVGTINVLTESTKRQKQKSRFLKAIIEDYRFAKVCNRTKHGPLWSMYVGTEPVVDASGERIGPVVSLHCLAAVATKKPLFRNLWCGGNVLETTFRSARRTDPLLSFAPIIVSAYETFQSYQKYEHLGIRNHRQVSLVHKPNSRSRWEVLVEFKGGDCQWIPLQQFAKDDVGSCAKYAKANNLLGTKGWTQFRRYEEHDVSDSHQDEE